MPLQNIPESNKIDNEEFIFYLKLSTTPTDAIYMDYLSDWLYL